jgi:hypothetical protein
MKEKRHIQFFRQSDVPLQTGDLIGPGRIHTVKIQAAFTDGDDPGILFRDPPDDPEILFFSLISAVGMDPGGAPGVMGLYKIMDPQVFFPVGTGQDTGYACRRRVREDFLRIFELPAEKISPIS